MNATRIVVEKGPGSAGQPGGGLGLRALRAGMGALGAVAPGAAARLAERLWFTPPRSRPPRDAASRHGATRPFALYPGGREVVGWTLGDGPAVLLMHGWGGSAVQLLPLAEAVAARGLRAVALDAPAHGASGPSRLGRGQSTFFDFADALLEAAALLGPAVALAAHSGGAVATHLALRGGLSLERVVLLAPMSRPTRYADRYREALGIPAEVDAAWRAQAAARLGFAWDDLDLVRSVPDEPPRTLVVHDRQDREVDFADGEAVAGRWPGARLVATSGLGHRRLLREPRVIRLAADFLAGARHPPSSRPRVVAPQALETTAQRSS